MDAEEEVDQQGQKRARSGDESDGGEDDAAAGSPGSPDGDGDLATPRGRKGARGAAPDSPGGGGDDDEGEGEDLFEDDERCVGSCVCVVCVLTATTHYDRQRWAWESGERRRTLWKG